MTYRIIIEPTAEREIRAAVRWKTQHASPTVAARWYNGLFKKEKGTTLMCAVKNRCWSPVGAIPTRQLGRSSR